MYIKQVPSSNKLCRFQSAFYVLMRTTKVCHYKYSTESFKYKLFKNVNTKLKTTDPHIEKYRFWVSI